VRPLLNALLSNQPLAAEEIADLAKRRLRLKIPQLREALQEHQMNDHHRWLIGQSIRHIVFLDEQWEELEVRIQGLLEPYRSSYELWLSIPGIKEHTAATILSEMGANREQFPSADGLCSWAGLCPGNNRSGGKSRSRSCHIQKANKFLLVGLVEASWAAARRRGTRLEAQFRRWSTSRGGKRAVIALSHSVLRTIYAMLRDGVAYREPDPRMGVERERARQIRHHAKRLRELGMEPEACDQLIESMMQASPCSSPAPTAVPLEYITSERPTKPCRGALGFRARAHRAQRRRKSSL